MLVVDVSAILQFLGSMAGLVLNTTVGQYPIAVYIAVGLGFFVLLKVAARI